MNDTVEEHATEAVASERIIAVQRPALEPVQAADENKDQYRWTRWLVLFLRVMAVVSMMKGLYHWSVVLGIGEGPDSNFSTQSVPWQTATVYFAIIDLVAAVGLWLAAVWGAVVWLTAGVSMAAVEVFFPQIYGGSMLVVVIELILLCCYLVLALQSAREHPH
jgi:fatty acid desaturase